jgi:hypothetical protein
MCAGTQWVRLLLASMLLASCVLMSACHWGNGSPSTDGGLSIPDLCLTFTPDTIDFGAIATGNNMDRHGYNFTIGAAFDGRSIWVVDTVLDDPVGEHSRISRIGCNGAVLLPPAKLVDEVASVSIASSKGAVMLTVGAEAPNAAGGPMWYAIYDASGRAVVPLSHLTFPGPLPGTGTLRFPELEALKALPLGGFFLNGYSAYEPAEKGTVPILQTFDLNGNATAPMLVGETLPGNPCNRSWSAAVQADNTFRLIWSDFPGVFGQGVYGDRMSVKTAVVPPGHPEQLNHPTVLEENVDCPWTLDSDSSSQGYTYQLYKHMEPDGRGTMFIRDVNNQDPNTAMVQIDGTGQQLNLSGIGFLVAAPGGGLLQIGSQELHLFSRIHTTVGLGLWVLALSWNSPLTTLCITSMKSTT